MSALLLLVLSVLSLPSREVGAWNQQFGDPHSTSYVASNVTYTADWNMNFGTSFNNEQYLQVYNPAVSEQGAIFLPLQPHGMGVSVVAINPTGKVLWQASLASECTVVTNVLYSAPQKSVFVGCGASIPFNISFTYLYAINASSGDTLWSQYILNSTPAKLLALSESENLLFFFGVVEFTAVKAVQNYSYSCVLYLKLATGESFWEDKKMYCDGLWDAYGYTETKVGKINASDHLLAPIFNQEIVVLLRTQGPGPAEWSRGVHNYEYYANLYLGFAISEETGAAIGSVSFMPWLTGGFPNHYYMFGLQGGDGSVIFNTTGHCSNSSAIVSPPALDDNGFAYYSCGQQVVSLYISNSKLRWRSKEVTHDYKLGNPPLSPSLHIKNNLLYYVSAMGTISVLSMEDGGDVAEIKITNDVVVHPPILVGDSFMYLLTHSPGDGANNVTVSLMKL